MSSKIVLMKRLKIACLFFSCVLFLGTANAQERETSESGVLVTNSFWDNWFGQVGTDLHLLFPVGHSLKDVFPNGQSVGVNAAVGKWFSPVLGGRVKVNWGNGIFNNDKNTWLSPYGVPGENHRQGGFFTFVGDISFNLHNLFYDYRPDRKWNLVFSTRAGGWIDAGTGGGAPVLGFGMVNTYRLSERWRLFADAGYHFVASINGIASGKGHAANSYGELNFGIETDLSSSNLFRSVSAFASLDEKVTKIDSFWADWFVQAGIGMSLLNPYGTNFKDTFQKGRTVGINLSLGKWFTHEAGVRGGVNWQDGIIVSRHASYLDPLDSKEVDPDKHGYLCAFGDFLLNLHAIIAGPNNERRWNSVVYPRMGVVWNFSSSYKECPVLGFGTEQLFSISDQIKVYADIAYQVTTGGFLDTKFPTGDTGSTGWFDFNIGVQYQLGKRRK